MLHILRDSMNNIIVVKLHFDTTTNLHYCVMSFYSGLFKPGMNAIMGPTGCGKTT